MRLLTTRDCIKLILLSVLTLILVKQFLSNIRSARREGEPCCRAIFLAQEKEPDQSRPTLPSTQRHQSHINVLVRKKLVLLFLFNTPYSPPVPLLPVASSSAAKS